MSGVRGNDSQLREVVDSKVEYEQAIYDYETMGWKVIDKRPGRAVLKLPLRGTWLWHLLLIFILPILGNVIYSFYRRMGDRPKRLVIRRPMNTEEERTPEDGRPTGDSNG